MSRRKSKYQREAEELENRLKRALADYDNLKKRIEKEKEELAQFANQILLLKILPVLEGLDLVKDQLGTLLEEEGLEEIEVKKGQKFNPEIMEAVDAEGGGEKVVAIISKGYKLHGKVIRPVRVKVGK